VVACDMRPYRLTSCVNCSIGRKCGRPCVAATDQMASRNHWCRLFMALPAGLSVQSKKAIENAGLLVELGAGLMPCACGAGQFNTPPSGQFDGALYDWISSTTSNSARL